MAISEVGSIAKAVSVDTANHKEYQSESVNSQASNRFIDNAVVYQTVNGNGQDDNNEVAIEPYGIKLGEQASKGQIEDAIKNANNQIKITNTRCEFEYHEKSKRVSIKVIDKDTEKVVKEIPPEESIEMVEKLWELAGLFLDEKR